MVRSLSKMGELRSAVAQGDLSRLHLTGMPEDVVRHYLARVPVNVLMTGCEWYREGGAPRKYTLQPIRKGGTLMLCGVEWIEVRETDLARMGPRWACGAAWSVLHVWEDWARAHAPEHLDAPRRCIEVTWAYLDGKASEEEMRRAQDAAYTAARAANAADNYAAACAAACAADSAYAAYSAAYAAANASAYAAYAADSAASAAAARERHKRVLLRWWTCYVLEEMR
jgi:hypothetical protein